MPFKPGVSGNVNGRPRVGTSLAERIRELGGPTGDVYVQVLHGIATNEDEATRLRIDAIKVLLDRGFGGPPQEVQHIESPEVMRAGALREILRSEGLLNGTLKPQPSVAESSMTPEIRAWINGDL